MRPLKKRLTRLKYELNTILTRKAEFALFSAWQKFFEEGDKAGRMLARYVQQKALRVQGDVLLTDPDEINSAFRDFYISLYSSESHGDKQEIGAFLTFLGLPTLSEDQVASLDQPIIMEEIAEAIQNLPSGKAPGPDGFTAEFYKAYVEELSPLLLNMYCEAMDRGSLPPSLSDV